MKQRPLNLCEVCGDPLDYFIESELLDCGHYACSSCTYTEEGKSRLETYCEKCHEKLMEQKEV